MQGTADHFMHAIIEALGKRMYCSTESLARMAIERSLEGSDGHQEAHGRPLQEAPGAMADIVQEGMQGLSADQHGTKHAGTIWSS